MFLKNITAIKEPAEEEGRTDGEREIKERTVGKVKSESDTGETRSGRKIKVKTTNGRRVGKKKNPQMR